AVITLPAAFSDRFANGTHTLEVFFTDAMGTGSGKVELVVNRAFGTGETGNGPGAIIPDTGDETQAGLLFALSFLALCCLLGLLIFIRRRRKEANR
ncbi:MAG: LPXTG cell wall anchor domain-containing protein, partial [Clostridiales Family XIII bacterium]|nr:LPXTG cell wall anchor domain-containing protein [Clostridiales Family XIII bacterium]